MLQEGLLWGRKSESLLERFWLFQASSYCDDYSHINQRTDALGWGSGSGQIMQPLTLGADGGTCMCQTCKSQKRGCAFSPPCSRLLWAVVFTSGLLTRGAGRQNHEGLLAIANASGQEGAGHLMDLFGLAGF